MLILELPWPPSVNHAYWNKPNGSRVKNAKAKKFRDDVFLGAYRGNSLKGRLFVTVYLYPPDKRKRDIDNPIKILLDCLEYAEVFENDNQIAKLLIERREVEKPGKVIVEIEAYI